MSPLRRSCRIAVFQVIAGLWASVGLAETIYVQSERGAIRERADLSAPVLHEVPRGALLQVMAREGAWYRISAGAVTGFIHRLFVGKQKPLESDALKRLSEDQDLGRSARRRSSSYAVTAATRGLTAGQRARPGRERYPSDPDALRRIESTRSDPEALRRFQQEGGLR